ncbi:MAG TPA: XRE family transcriptional regulator [Solirubrobacteraceae bacterium]|jgi:transcriptional regulator with XRE-family HTH domain/Zn-dependent peptidase ImmA (M78 family)|nr:XRE family transcriptional regulator [Solirubrobacteraceae bacterium]
MAERRWESRAYQTVESLTFDGRLHVRFVDGDEATLDVERLVARPPKGLDWSAARPRGQEVIVPSAEGEIDVPWTSLRGQSDPAFAEFLIGEADDEARRIGERLRALRVRRGMTAKQVAAAAGISPMSMSRIELGRHDVVFRTLRRILAAMDYTLHDLAEEGGSGVQPEIVIAAMRKAGVPARLVRRISEALRDDGDALAAAARRIFGVDPASASPGVQPQLVLEGRFKAAVNQRPELATYTMWAHWLALLVDHACPRPAADIPENPVAIRTEILKLHGSMGFSQLLDWCWDHQVAVLPLADPGEFHGACWSIDGRAVVVLKQVTPSDARWAFDLGHELAHVSRHLDSTSGVVVEVTEVGRFSEDDDEQEANDFAGELLLGEPDSLARELADRTEHQLQRLKAEVQKLAAERDLATGSLANYMAYRLGAEGEDWWATAAVLQDSDGTAAKIARQALLERLDRNRMTTEDAALLDAALDWRDS